jgi:hypothetical protein
MRHYFWHNILNTLCENEFFSEGDFLFLRGLLKAFLLLVLLVGRRVTMHKEIQEAAILF